MSSNPSLSLNCLLGTLSFSLMPHPSDHSGAYIDTVLSLFVVLVWLQCFDAVGWVAGRAFGL